MSEERPHKVVVGIGNQVTPEIRSAVLSLANAKLEEQTETLGAVAALLMARTQEVRDDVLLRFGEWAGLDRPAARTWLSAGNFLVSTLVKQPTLDRFARLFHSLDRDRDDLRGAAEALIEIAKSAYRESLRPDRQQSI